MHKLVSQCSGTYIAVSKENFCKINSLEEDKVDLSEEKLFFNLFDGGFDEGEAHPGPDVEIYLLPVVDRDQVFEEYEDRFFNDKGGEEELMEENEEETIKLISLDMISSWLIHDHEIGIYLIHNIDELPEREEYKEPEFPYLDLEEEIQKKIQIKNCHGKKSHFSHDRIEKFWPKEKTKINIRCGRELKQRMKMVV